MFFFFIIIYFTNIHFASANLYTALRKRLNCWQTIAWPYGYIINNIIQNNKKNLFKYIFFRMSNNVVVTRACRAAGTSIEKEPEYPVEKILGKRKRYGKVEYYLKWTDYGDEENSWEPEEHLNSCDILIKEFEDREKRFRKRNVQRRRKRKAYPTGVSVTSSNATRESSKRRKKIFPPGKVDIEVTEIFDSGDNDNVVRQKSNAIGEVNGDLKANKNPQTVLHVERVPEKIIGVNSTCRPYSFIVKWRNSDDVTLITSEEANVLCPQIVIEFYESRLKWTF